MNSSNYNPVDMWNVGMQLVALNYQTHSLEMNINQARFRDNGGVCGVWHWMGRTEVCGSVDMC